MNKIHHRFIQVLGYINIYYIRLYIKASSHKCAVGFGSKKHGLLNMYLFIYLSPCSRALTFLVSDPCRWCPGYGGGPVLMPARLDKTSHPPLWTSPGRHEAHRERHIQRKRRKGIIRWMPVWPWASKIATVWWSILTSLESLVKRSPPLRKSRIKYNFPSVWNATNTQSFNQITQQDWGKVSEI